MKNLFNQLNNIQYINNQGSLDSYDNNQTPLIKYDDNYVSLNEISSKFTHNHIHQDLTALHINTRSLTKNVGEVVDLIKSIPNYPDIIAISETRLNKTSDLQLVNIPGYKFFNNNSLSLAGGVGIYVKTNIAFTFRSDIIFSNKEYESIWIELHNNGKNLKNLVIGVIYRHPQHSLTEFTENFSNLMDNIANKNKDICIYG